MAGRQAAKGGLAPATLDDSIQRSAKTLGQVLEVWDTLHPLVRDFMVKLSTELAAIEKLEADEEQEVIYLSRKDGKKVSRDLWLREVSDDLVKWTEKLSRSLTSMTKAVDEASRLRDFLTGGDSSRQDLESASDQELIQVLVDVAIARGLWKTIRARAAEQGIQLDDA